LKIYFDLVVVAALPEAVERGPDFRCGRILQNRSGNCFCEAFLDLILEKVKKFSNILFYQLSAIGVHKRTVANQVQ